MKLIVGLEPIAQGGRRILLHCLPLRSSCMSLGGAEIIKEISKSVASHEILIMHTRVKCNFEGAANDEADEL